MRISLGVSVGQSFLLTADGRKRCSFDVATDASLMKVKALAPRREKARRDPFRQHYQP